LSSANHLSCRIVSFITVHYVQPEPKIPQHDSHNIFQKCANIFVLNFAHLFGGKLRKSVLLCAVFTSRTPNWRNCKLQERILQKSSAFTRWQQCSDWKFEIPDRCLLLSVWM